MSFKRITKEDLESFDFSNKESLNDIGLDQEEVDKIEHELTKSLQPLSLRVDYSEFKNHVFFGSAYWSVKFALAKIFDDLNGYPWDGTLKEKNEWRKNNSGFENYYFDEEFPKQFGYANFESGSSDEAYIALNDHQGKLNLGTGSLTVEFMFKPHHNLSNDFIIATYKSGATNSVGWDVTYDNANTQIQFNLLSGGTTETLNLDYSNYFSSSHYISAVYNTGSSMQLFYVDGDLKVSRSLSANIGNLNQNRKVLEIGNTALSSSAPLLASGALDDFRLWHNARRSELIKRNHFRTIHANHSGGLKLYYKFDEVNDVSPSKTVIDYSGNDLHGEFSGSYNENIHKISGTLATWFKNPGNPIFNTANTRVSSSITTWLSSGSNFDKENSNFIYNLVPSQFIENDQHDDMQLFLLLMGRHYDRLKLYIQHLANVLYSDESKYDNAPDELLNLLAENYGLDISGIYESGNALQYFFGEEILSTGSMNNSLQSVRNQLRRNLVNNLTYIIKTKSTRESINSSLRSLGFDEEIVNINEYSVLSGGIETRHHPITTEERVARFITSSNVLPSTASMPVMGDSNNDQYHAYEFRYLAVSSSAYLTSSLFTLFSGSDAIHWVQSIRENTTSSCGNIHFKHRDGSEVSSSLLPIYDDKWVNVLAQMKYTGSVSDPGGKFRLNVGILDIDEVAHHFSSSEQSMSTGIITSAHSASLGSSGSFSFDGYMQEYRFWRLPTSMTMSSKVFDRHVKDYTSLAVDDFKKQISGSLKTHLKLNDATGSSTGDGNLHDWTDGNNFSRYINFSSSADFNFPGVYLDKLKQSLNYDIGTDNDKVRIKDQNKLNKNEISEDIPFVSVDVSPIVSLNKEIVKWFGDLEKFNDIIGYPYWRFREETSDLNSYKRAFFDNKIISNIDIKAYLDLIKWFDSNFTYFIKQLVPMDLESSISNFAIESHLLEHNKVDEPFLQKVKSPVDVSGSANATAEIKSSLSRLFGLADPGRFGAAVDVVGEIEKDYKVDYDKSFSGSDSINYRKLQERSSIDTQLSGNLLNFAPKYHGNGFYATSITSSNYYSDVLSVNKNFQIDKIHFGNDSINSEYLSSSQGAPANTQFTGTFNGLMDQKWLWQEFNSSQNRFEGPTYDFGIGYGGGWGQLWFISNKSLASPDFGGVDPVVNLASVGPAVEVFEKGELSNTHILWPTFGDFNGTKVKFQDPGTGDEVATLVEDGSAAQQFGPIINIEGFDNLEMVIDGTPEPVNRSSLSSTHDFTVKFQFFDKEGTGTKGFETILSSSISSGKIINTELTNEYQFSRTYNTSEMDAGESFVIHLNKTLPDTKFMRVFVRMASTANSFSEFNFLISVKGKLTKIGEQRDIRDYNKV